MFESFLVREFIMDFPEHWVLEDVGRDWLVASGSGGERGKGSRYRGMVTNASQVERPSVFPRTATSYDTIICPRRSKTIYAIKTSPNKGVFNNMCVHTLENLDKRTQNRFPQGGIGQTIIMWGRWGELLSLEGSVGL